jgi:hypothetical protein
MDKACGSARIGRRKRIFATKAALTTRIIEAGMPRSRFGRSDSWFIKMWGAAVLAAGI